MSILFYEKQEPVEVPDITAQFAQAIYDGFKAKKSRTQLFEEDVINSPFIKEYIQQIYDEKNALEAEVLSKMRGTFVITEEQTDEEGNITQEAVYFQVGTKTALIESLTSTFDAETFVNDMIKWANKDYNESRTWVEYKALFTNGGE